MLFNISKLLQPLLWPYNQAMILLLVSVILLWIGRTKWAKYTVTFVFLFLFVLSMPWLAIGLCFRLENRFPPQVYSELPVVDAIVVPGGTVSSLAPPRVEVDESNGARVVPAFILLKLKKAPVILVSSGSPYLTREKNTRVEAQDMRDLLLALGAPESAILVEGRSRNTSENAVESAKILKSRSMNSILLVTSAYHMPRALKHFEAQGLKVIPVATEHRLVDRPVSFWDFIPSEGALGMTTGAMKEYLGTFVYQYIGVGEDK